MSNRTSVGRVVIVGLGPGPRNTVTEATLQAIASIPHQFVRTRKHPTADLLPEAQSFDHLYESLSTFDDVYAAINTLHCSLCALMAQTVLWPPISSLTGMSDSSKPW